MTYEPIPEGKKQEWISWLEGQVKNLNGKPEIPTENRVFQTDTGDVAAGKDLVGNLLALLTNKPVTIQ